MPKFVGENRLPELLTLMKNRFRSVIDGYYNSANGKFYKESTYTTEITGETGKVIYVSLDTENEYRWNGTAFIRINEGVTLGETSTTAYRGDRGKTAYDVSQTVGSVSNLTTTDKTTVVNAINELDLDKQEKLQFSNMPTASNAYLYKVVQYIGNTDANYTQNYFYKCIYSNSYYVWRQVNVQDGTISLELTMDEYNALSDDQKDNGTVYYVTDVLPFEPNNAVMGFTPIGTVIAVMGNTAPKNYLACNGQVVNIADYTELADYFEDEFGSKNYFGGNGTTTFAIPDLRGEFLRGTGINSHTNQGSGANVGVHQDGTTLPLVVGSTNSFIVAANENYLSDTDYTSDYSAARNYIGGTTRDDNGQLIRVRPTNTSVLYCIAYKNIYIESVGGSGGTTDYTDLTNKPQINGNELTGNKTSAQLGLTDVTWTQSVSTGTKIAEIDINGTTTDVYAPSGGSGSSGHEIQESGTAMPTEPALNFEDFDLDDNSTDSSTDVKPHRLSSAELDEIVTAPPSVYRGYEYSESEQVVGHWIDGKPIYQCSYLIASLSVGTTWTDTSINVGDRTIIDAILACQYFSIFAIYTNNTKIQLRSLVSSTIPLTNAVLTIKYTKTTD